MLNRWRWGYIGWNNGWGQMIKVKQDKQPPHRRRCTPPTSRSRLFIKGEFWKRKHPPDKSGQALPLSAAPPPIESEQALLKGDLGILNPLHAQRRKNK